MKPDFTDAELMCWYNEIERNESDGVELLKEEKTTFNKIALYIKQRDCPHADWKYLPLDSECEACGERR